MTGDAWRSQLARALITYGDGIFTRDPEPDMHVPTCFPNHGKVVKHCNRVAAPSMVRRHFGNASVASVFAAPPSRGTTAG